MVCQQYVCVVGTDWVVLYFADQFWVEMPEAKVSWLLCLGRHVFKIDNVAYCTCLVKQAKDLLTFYGYTTIAFSWGWLGSSLIDWLNWQGF